MKWRDVKEDLLSNPEVSRVLEEEFPYRPVADAILRVRAQFGLTQAELGERIGTSQSAIARAESGQHPVEVSLLRRISKALNLRYEITFVPVDFGPSQPLVSARR